MSTTDSPTDPQTSTDGQLTDDERALFERLADQYDGDDVGRIARTVLQSSTDSEEASS